jgi:hypothetical protein
MWELFTKALGEMTAAAAPFVSSRVEPCAQAHFVAKLQR